jgi:beta-N-acetylhexosaminidase
MTNDSVRNLVGKLLIAGFDGLTINDHVRQLIQVQRCHNIILFSRNVASVAQLQELTGSLQELAMAEGFDRPLLIATDQENGIVRRVAPDVPGLPGNMAVGATANPRNAYQVGRATARVLTHVGIHMNLAPVLDVNNNPANPVIGVRSYGESPEQVSIFGHEMARGLQEHGVIACVKHFPGHGDTSGDSHLELVEVPHSMERLRQVELMPFRAAIEANVDAMMTAHVAFPAIDERRIPATLSPLVLTAFLRQKLDFQGVITSDCMEMNAISQTVGVGQGAVQAVAAGCDMVMVSHRIDRQEDAAASLAQAIQDGRVTELRLLEAVRRIDTMRARRCSADEGMNVETESIVHECITLQTDLSRKAATIVANRACHIPVSADDIQIIDILMDGSLPSMMAADDTASYEFLCHSIRGAFPLAATRLCKFAPNMVSFDHERLKNSDLIVVGLCGTDNYNYLNAIHSLVEDVTCPLIVLAMHSPYDLSAVADLPTLMAGYEFTPWMVDASVNAIIGVGGTGQLPVSIPGITKRGSADEIR